MFVSHPDDDVLFFNRVMKNEKPYVVLLTTGFSIIRMKEFKKAMKYYGLRYNYYDFETADEREEKLCAIIAKELRDGNFLKCYSHSPYGEYGHAMHKRVGKAVIKTAECPVFTTVHPDAIDDKSNRLTESELKEKVEIFETIYKSQDFVLDHYPQWVQNEKITEVQR
ncbi:MAG: PIG-L family deacetylase [Clostridia bacterium]|nr:PIG-L family deacetylase [Clostridia bacterium]